jgi:hypothetical protein
MPGKYKVHRFDIRRSGELDPNELEEFLNNLKGEVIALVPNVTYKAWGGLTTVTFLLIVERVEA